MKILLVSHRYPPAVGGVETHVQALATEFARAGHEVLVETTDPTLRGDSRERVEDGVRIHEHPSVAPNNAYFLSPRLGRAVRQSAPHVDVIHAHNYHAFPALHAFFSKGRTPFVFTGHYHGTGHTALRKALHTPYAPLARRLFEHADRVIAVSEAERQLVESRFRARHPIRVIPNGLALGEFEAVAVQRDPHLLVSAGRIESYKRIDLIIDAIAARQDMRLWIFGDGPAQAAIRKRADSSPAAGRIEFKGRVPRPQLLEAIARSRALVSMSENEAFGIAPLEAAALGTPSVVSPIVAHLELAKRLPEHIIPVARADAASIATAIDALPLVGVPRADLQEFSWRSIAARTIDLYHEVLA